MSHDLPQITSLEAKQNWLLTEFKDNSNPNIFSNCYNYFDFKRRLRPGRSNENIERLKPLLRKLRPDEDVAWGTFDYDTYVDECRLCYFDKSTGLPTESFTDNFSGNIEFRQFYKHNQETTLYPHRDLGVAPLPITKQIELEFHNNMLKNIFVRRMILTGHRSDSGLEKFFLVSISKFSEQKLASDTTGMTIWAESLRVYFQPGEEFWDRNVVYEPDKRGKLANPKPPYKFWKIAGIVDQIALPSNLSIPDC